MSGNSNPPGSLPVNVGAIPTIGKFRIYSKLYFNFIKKKLSLLNKIKNDIRKFTVLIFKQKII